MGSYEDVEYILDRVTEKQRLESTVEQIARQPPANLKDIVRRAGGTIQGETENLPPGSILLDATTDDQGRIVQRSVDESGTVLESTINATGDTVSENIVGMISDLLT